MNIYLVTCKVTHARMVVACKTAQEAVRTHPTCWGAVWKPGGWTRAKGGHVYRWVAVNPPPSWTHKTELLHATLLGKSGRDCPGGVLAWQEDLTLRQGAPNQEGPDDTWGGYTLDDL